jgi:hypothetical protein
MKMVFKSSITRLGPILTPERIMIDDNAVTYTKRNSHLIGVDEISIPLNRISGVEVNKHLWGATIFINSTGTKTIIAKNFTWKDAKNVQREINRRIGG